MTLIFSNNNRLLFNLESNDQLLELCYGNRFNALLSCKKVKKGASTSYKVYLERDIRANFLTILKFDSFFVDAKRNFAFKQSRDLQLKTGVVFYKETNQSELIRGKSFNNSLLSKTSASVIVNLGGKAVQSEALQTKQSFVSQRRCPFGQRVARSKSNASTLRLSPRGRQGLMAVQSYACKSPICTQSGDNICKKLCTCTHSFVSTSKKTCFSRRPSPKAPVEGNCKTNLFDLVKDQDTASLALQSFSEIEILSLYGLLRDQPVLIQNFFKNAFSNVQDFALNKSSNQEFASKQSFLQDTPILKTRSTKSLYALCNALNLISKNGKALSDARFVSVANSGEFKGEASPFEKKGKTKFNNEKEQGFSSKYKALFCKKSELDLFLKKVVVATSPEKLLGLLLITEPFAYFKEKVSIVKNFLPKTKIWGFTFGTSFLLVSMISILQRQEENQWLLTFSKNQMPGLSLSAQESSWECFENITLKYLNRKTFAYKHPSAKGLVKQIHCYKDLWLLSFSELWNQQFLQNYTAIFSDSFDKAKLCTQSQKQISHLNSVLQLSNKSCSTDRRFVRGDKLCTCKANFTVLKVAPFSSLIKDLTCCSDMKNKWFTQSWYQMHARVPPREGKSTLLPFYELIGKQNPRGRNPRFTNSIKKSRGAFSFEPCKIAFFKINRYKNRINAENDSIPSKMSCSTRLLFSETISSWLASPKSKPGQDESRNKKNLYLHPIAKGEETHTSTNRKLVKKALQKASTLIDCKPHDRLKNLFYDSSNFSIEAQVFQENSQETDSLYDDSLSFKQKKNAFEKLIDKDRFSFLQRTSSFKPDCFLGKQSLFGETSQAMSKTKTDLLTQEDRTYLDYPLDLLKRDGSQKKALQSESNCPATKKYRLYQSYRHKLIVENDQRGYKKTSFFKPKGCSSCLYLFPYSQGSRAEKGCYINIEPSLSKSTEKLSSYFLYKRNSVSNRLMSGYQLPEIKDLQFKKGVHKKTICLPKVSIKVPPALPFCESKIKKWKLFLQINQEWLRKAPLLSLSEQVFKEDQAFPLIQSHKTMPYRQLCLNELQEVEPLFEQVNKSFRVSPYHFAFKKYLFTDYNDYLSWSKDSSTAISILPSIEEEEALKKSWFAEQLFSKERLAQNKSLDHLQTESETTPHKSASLQVQNSGLQKDLLDEIDFSSKDQMESKDHPSVVEEERVLTSLPIGEDEEKKREITKFEWLQQVREAENPVEKRKDFKKLAYPSQEALFTKRLQVKPGSIQSLLVRDRKLSFFGITNLFPKRLIAQDQKQINSQILRDEEDRQFVFLLEQASFNNENNNKICSPTIDPKNGSLIENSLRGVALHNAKTFSERNIFTPESTMGKQNLYMPLSKKEMPSSLRTVPRNQQKSFAGKVTPADGKYPSTSFARSKSVIFRTRQHPIYAPNRRLRLRAPQLSFSFQNSNPQSRIDDLNLSQSHRWWQKRRTTSNLLGAPSKRYLVMPEITTQDWKKIIEWQLKTYFLEEEKRLEPLVLEKDEAQKADFSLRTSFLKGVRLDSAEPNQIKHLFKIKKIAVYLPWTTLKKSLKKPFEWPLTGLSYDSFGLQNKASHTNLVLKVQSFTKNKKPDPCFISSISPHFKTSLFSLSNRKQKPNTPDILPSLVTDSAVNRLHESSVYKPFIFEARTEHSYLLFHQLLLAVATKQLFQSIYKVFGKVIAHKLKNSSLAVLLLPIFFNSTSRKNQISEFIDLKKRLRDLVGSEDTISSLSEIVWYLRNSCRGRMLPRGVVLVETLSSESTDYLKAIGGEAQVPVIVQSLRALPFTQNHPQRRLEKILSFAQKRAPCILFLDDLDSIGQSRTLLLKGSYKHLTGTKTELFSSPASLNQIPGNSRETSEKRKWKKEPNDLNYSCNVLPKANLRFVLGAKQDFASSSFLDPSCNTNLQFAKPKAMPYKSCRFLCRNRKSSQSHGCSSYLWCNPFAGSKTNNGKENRKVQLQNQEAGRSESGTQDLSQLSETEKTVEQRRVDLMLRLLTVMDGITHFNGVLIVTTSKNPASLDPALLRPGRFEKLINLKLPNKKKRIELLKIETAKIGYMNSMPWEYFGMQTQNMTGTEISSAVNHSAFRAIMESTLHTFPTLEYGISRVSGRGFHSENPEIQLKKCFQQKGKNFTKKRVGTSFETRALQPPENKYKAKQSFAIAEEVRQKQDKSKAVSSCKLKQCFLKSIVVHNPYTTRLNQKRGLSTQVYQSKNLGQKIGKIASQTSFYQAGKGVICSSIFSANNSSGRSCLFPFKSSLPTPFLLSSCQKRGQHLKNNGNCRDIAFKQDRAKNQEDRYKYNLIPSSFAENLIRSYAGQASESFYLDSIYCFKKKAFSNLFSQLSFLQSTLSYKEKVQGASPIENIATNLQFYPGVTISRRFAIKLCKSGVEKEICAKKGLNYKKPWFFCPETAERDVRKLRYLKSTNRFNKSFYIRYNGSNNLRKYLQLYANYERNDFAHFYNRTGANSLWAEKVSETIKIFKRQSGNWYRIYLPKIEQDKSNREWLLPDLFSNQHISFLKEKDLQNRRFVLQPFSKVRFAALHSRKKVYCSRLNPVGKTRVFRQKASCNCFSHYNTVLNAFYTAFQNCNENRELLDLVADHLIRFKIVRAHEIMRIGAFYF